MSQPRLLGLVRKEAQALWLVWAGCAAVCVAAAATGLRPFVMPGRLAYFIGSVALAAMTVGHEYTRGTLPTLLSLPVDRRRLIVAKLLALVPMLVSLGLLALAIGSGGPYFERGTVIGGLSVLAAATLAPWLTMVCRSPLAGAVFALGIAGMMQLASLGVVLAWYRLAGPSAIGMQSLHNRVLAVSLVAISVIAAIAGWRTFIRLEAIDGRDHHFAWPSWARSAMARADAELLVPGQRSHPLWLLLKKELRIQQMAIVVAGINVLIWLSTYAFVRRDITDASVMAVVALLYGGLLAVLIGALASAEERRLGTLEWQTLLPVPAWRQFALKTAVALTLSLLLAFALPLLLARGELAITAVHASAVLLLTIGSMYVSSRCDNGLQAMVSAAATLFLISVLLGLLARFFFFFRADIVLTIGATMAVVALRSAFVNHRTAR